MNTISSVISMYDRNLEFKAFGGAEGFGAKSLGGLGGRIIEVTNLNPSGKGSLEAALAAKEPRIVVFKVSGEIILKKKIYVRNPYITIAGHTSPKGITIRNGTLVFCTHDIILRGLRIRVGNDPEGTALENRDGIGIEQADECYNIIIDHCSISWGVDENIATWYPCHDITFQWCIISEALYNSGHPKGKHSMGLLVGIDSQRISVHHCLFAHNMDRNPRYSSNSSGEIINNVVYNWEWQGTYLGNEGGDTNVNILGNTYIKGKNTGNNYGITIHGQMPTTSKVYINNNVLGDKKDIEIVNNNNKMKFQTALIPECSSGLVPQPNQEAFLDVLRYAGAIMPVRDAHDQRIVNDVIYKTGAFIDSHTAVGG